MRTYNRCVKNRLKILNCLWKFEKKSDNLRGGFFLTHTVLLFSDKERTEHITWYDASCIKNPRWSAAVAVTGERWTRELIIIIFWTRRLESWWYGDCNCCFRTVRRSVHCSSRAGRRLYENICLDRLSTILTRAVKLDDGRRVQMVLGQLVLTAKLARLTPRRRTSWRRRRRKTGLSPVNTTLTDVPVTTKIVDLDRLLDVR